MVNTQLLIQKKIYTKGKKKEKKRIINCAPKWRKTQKKKKKNIKK